MSEALNNLEKVILDRKKQFAESGLSSDEIKKKSYTCYLFSQVRTKSSRNAVKNAQKWLLLPRMTTMTN